jgi:hypothetical protein
MNHFDSGVDSFFMSSSQISQVVGLMVAPVVLISSSALLLGSIYSRLAACIGRTRHFDAQVQKIIEKRISGGMNSKLSELYTRQVRSIRNQGEAVLKRARKLQTAIYMFEITVCLMILTGMMAALSLVNEGTFVPLTLVVMILGMLFLLAGAVFSMQETALSLGPVETEFLQVVELTLEDEREYFYDDQSITNGSATPSVMDSRRHSYRNVSQNENPNQEK